jgi:hypothetical protein
LSVKTIRIILSASVTILKMNHPQTANVSVLYGIPQKYFSHKIYTFSENNTKNGILYTISHSRKVKSKFRNLGVVSFSKKHF